MTITPSATAGTTITASDENARNNTVTTAYNSHGHTDISQTANTLNVGDGAAGDKQVCANAADSTDSCIKWDDSENMWLIDQPTKSSFNQIVTMSGTSGITARTMLLADDTGAIIGGTTLVPAATAPVEFGDFSARAFNSANISITSGSATIITLNSERFDTDTIHSTSSNTGRLTATSAGKYQITGHIEMANSLTADEFGYIRLEILLNGSTVIASEDTRPNIADGVTTRVSISTYYDLSATDFVELRITQTLAATLNVLNASNFSPEFEMVKVP